MQIQKTFLKNKQAEIAEHQTNKSRKLNKKNSG
jgi:hypothetical protein